MFTTGILADIWNVVDLGIEPSLDLIQSVGATSISLRVTSSRVSQLRAGEIDGPRIFRSDGGYFFQPDKSKYSNTRIKPVTASWLKSRDPLEQIAESCKKRDLELRLRINALELPVIASRHPEAATKTVFGDVSPETLSASNPDVVELLRATVVDLSNRLGPSAIELDELCFHSGADFKSELCVGMGFHALLEPSFDESSAQSAIVKGVDVDAVLRLVKVKLEPVLQGTGSLDDPLWKLMEDHPVLKSYIDSQVEDVTDLVTQIASAVECPLSVVFISDGVRGFFPRAECEAIAHDRGVIIESYASDGDEEHDSDNGHFFGADRLPQSRIVRQFRLTTAVGVPDRFVSAVVELAKRGVGGVTVSTCGLTQSPSFETVKQAFRYARREAR